MYPYKSLLLVLLMTFGTLGCEKEEPAAPEEELTAVSYKWRKKKKRIKICYTDRYGHSRILRIRKSAWKWFKRRNAVRLDDQDGDGFVPDNACGHGQMGDCDDKDPNVNPDVLGSCGDNVDSDGDGVIDSKDECPDEAGPSEFNGCPDADGDGIADKDDECPNEAGPASNNGCPNTELSDYEVLRLVYELNPDNNLEWDLSNESMDDWKGVFLNTEGNVLSLRFLFGHNIEVLPPEIGGLKDLGELVCACENLEVLPPEIGQLTNLASLGIIGSRIIELPQEISMLPNLLGLAIFDNTNFNKIPSWIGNLQNLQGLDLSGNNIAEIPEQLANLTRLEVLSLRSNPVTIIPQAICDLADADTEVVLDADDVCQ